MTGFTAPRAGLGANQLTIDWNGLTYVDGTKVVVDFTAAPIPEPETYAMLALGLGMFGAVGAARRRRAA
ncbi:MAG: PEP-CTERM sorting domain-containing protein [Caldimonas sp.]